MTGHLPSLTKMPTVRLAMTPFPHSIEIDAPAEDAWAMMLRHEIRHLPVTDGGALVGIISERDLRLVLRPGVEAGEVSVRDACEGEVFSVPDHLPLDQVLEEMAERHIGSAVVRKNDALVGILTVTDVCRHLMDVLRDRFGPSKPPPDSAA